MTAVAQDRQATLLRTVARAADVLRAADIPFALTGGCAVYARGGPASDHDVDLLVRQCDVPAATRALVRAGMRAAETPLDWLSKVYDGDVLVDLLFSPNHRPVTDEVLARAEPMRVGATKLPVAQATDLLVDRLLLFGPHRCDFTAVLPIAQALREQIDWPRVAEAASESPYAQAFVFLVRRLGLVTDLEVSI